MKEIEKWNELFSIHKKTSRYQILKRTNNLMIFYVLLIIYICISASTFLLIKTHFYLALTIVIVSAAIIGFVLSSYVQKTSTIDIKNFPRRSREQLVKYQVFSSEFKRNAILKQADIDKLVSWAEIKNLKIQSLNIFLNPIVASTLGYLAKAVIPENKLTELPPSILVSLILAFFTLMFFVWSLRDIVYQSRNIEFEICRFLKWLKVDRSRA